MALTGMTITIFRTASIDELVSRMIKVIAAGSISLSSFTLRSVGCDEVVNKPGSPRLLRLVFLPHRVSVKLREITINKSNTQEEGPS
jgi:hypothetical protein